MKYGNPMNGRKCGKQNKKKRNVVKRHIISSPRYEVDFTAGLKKEREIPYRSFRRRRDLLKTKIDRNQEG